MNVVQINDREEKEQVSEDKESMVVEMDGTKLICCVQGWSKPEFHAHRHQRVSEGCHG
jgi:hypothetical protein